MRKDYIFNTYESVDFELNDCGTSEFSLRFDRMLNFLFSDVELYSDSGRTVPLSAADWEDYTTDTVYTTKEGVAGGSGKTIYSQIKVVNATYQTGTLYGTCNNFGSYASGNAQGPDFQEITATGSYTVDPQIKEAVLDASATTSTITITISGGTHPSGNAGIMNRVKIVGSDTVKTIVTDGTLTFWVEPGQVVDFYLKGTTLMWASGAWELLWEDSTNTVQDVSLSLQNIGGSVEIGDIYKITAGVSTNLDAGYTGVIEILYLTDYQYPDVAPPRFRINNTLGTFGSDTSSLRPKKLTKWHNAS